MAVPRFISIVLPLTLFGSIIFAYSKLEQDNEIVIMRSSGISNFQIARPALILAFCATIFVWTLEVFIVPYGEASAKKLYALAQSKLGVSLLKEGSFTNIGEHFTIYFEEKEADGTLINIFIQDTRNADNVRSLFANLGKISDSQQGPVILLREGIQQYQGTNKQLYAVDFREYVLSINIEDSDGPIWRKPSVRGTKELLLLPDAHLLSQKQTYQMRAELHHRLAGAFRVFALAMIATICIICAPFQRSQQYRAWLIWGIIAGIIVILADLLIASIASKHAYLFLLIYLFNGSVIGICGLFYKTPLFMSHMRPNHVHPNIASNNHQ